jgi:putative ABC transport system ATP-binding protein
MQSAIRLTSIVKIYTRGSQKVEVLHGLSLDVQEGEFISVMGPSGSGKTTLLNLIAGLDTPTSGELVVANERIDKLSRAQRSAWRARNIGFVFQFYNLLPVLTASRNVELPLLLTRLNAAQRRERVAAALQLVGLADRSEHRPGELSGGQQQRVSIARALVADPSIFVCDEPTGDLDRESAKGVLELLQMLNRDRGKTIIMVTHDPLAANHATRQIYLDKGLLVIGAARAA